MAHHQPLWHVSRHQTQEGRKIDAHFILETSVRLIGITGILLVLAAFFALQKGVWSSQGEKYLAYNALGALFLLVTTITEWNLATFLINAIWLVITWQTINKQKLKN